MSKKEKNKSRIQNALGRKRTVPAKQYRTAPAKRKSTVLVHDATADIPNGKPWTISVEPGKRPTLPTTCLSTPSSKTAAQE